MWHGHTTLASMYPQLYEIAVHKNIVVRDFYIQWHSNQRRPLLWKSTNSHVDWLQENVEAIDNILKSLSFTCKGDVLAWLPAKGPLTASKVYETLYSYHFANPQDHTWGIIWSVRAPPKIKVFL